MNRNTITAVAFLVMFVGLGAAYLYLSRDVAAQARSAPLAPAFEVDPLWPKPMPNHWVLGSTIGVSVDENDHVWIIHRSSATLGNNEKGLELSPPTGECCAGAPPVLEFDQAGNLLEPLGRSRRRLRVADLEPRHHRRLQGQRLDWRQRQRRRAAAEVHQERQVPAAGRQGQRAAGPARQGRPLHLGRQQQRSRPASAASPRSSWTRARTRRTSPTGI